jgi:hypothetical protein
LLIMAVAIIPVFRQGFLDVIGYKWVTSIHTTYTQDIYTSSTYNI